MDYEKFNFYKSWAEIFFEIKEDDEKLALQFVTAIIKYGIYDVDESETLPRSERRLFKLMMQTMNKAKQAVENGQKGGAPKGNQNARRKPVNATNGKNNQGLNEKQPPVETQNKPYTSSYTLSNNQNPVPVPSTKTSPYNQDHIPKPIACSFSEKPVPVTDDVDVYTGENNNDHLFQDALSGLEREGIMLSASAMQEVDAFLEAGMEPAVFGFAACLAKDQGAVTWNYAKAILQKWGAKGILTLQQAQQENAAFEAEKARRKREQAARAAGTRPADYYDPADYAKPDPDGTAWAEMFESLHAH